MLGWSGSTIDDAPSPAVAVSVPTRCRSPVSPRRARHGRDTWLRTTTGGGKVLVDPINGAAVVVGVDAVSYTHP
ncbi:hypothetical protein, partial [Verrucosispora sp. SN26_14.1]|uniref:hypothetical protein n=1 Tax=Verrucosispora sp. SN26_14.1 TaxID=2527879 RepID=UPI001F2E7C0E